MEKVIFKVVYRYRQGEDRSPECVEATFVRYSEAYAYLVDRRDSTRDYKSGWLVERRIICEKTSTQCVYYEEQKPLIDED